MRKRSFTKGPVEARKYQQGTSFHRGSAVPKRVTTAPKVRTKKLTDRQRQVLDFVERYVDERGFSPTIREIGAAVGLSSSDTIHKHLTNLVELGHLERKRNQPRTLRPVRQRNLLLEPWETLTTRQRAEALCSAVKLAQAVRQDDEPLPDLAHYNSRSANQGPGEPIHCEDPRFAAFMKAWAVL